MFDAQAERMRFGVSHERFRFVRCHFRERHDVFVAKRAMAAFLGTRHRVPILGAGIGNGEMEVPHKERYRTVTIWKKQA
jgi:hypothetical protein